MRINGKIQTHKQMCLFLTINNCMNRNKVQWGRLKEAGLHLSAPLYYQNL